MHLLLSFGCVLGIGFIEVRWFDSFIFCCEILTTNWFDGFWVVLQIPWLHLIILSSNLFFAFDVLQKFFITFPPFLFAIGS